MHMKMPSTLGLMAIILLIAAIATHVLQPGEYQRETRTIARPGIDYAEYTIQPGDTTTSIRVAMGLGAESRAPLLDPATRESIASPVPGQDVLAPQPRTTERTVVVQGSYEALARPDAGRGPVGLVLEIITKSLQAPIQGFVDKAEIIGFILLIGGAFGMILATGAIDNALRGVAEVFARRGQGWMLIAITMGLFSLGGAVFGMCEETIPFVLITVPLAIRLGYDAITGLCMSWMAAGLGFAAAFQNPFTIGVAQGIAEIPVFSGMGLRLVIWVSLTLIGILYVIWWAERVRRRPELSPTHENDAGLLERMSAHIDEHKGFTVRDGLVIATIAGAIALTAWGVVVHQWWMTEISGVFMGAGVLTAIFGGLSLSRAAAEFAHGAANVTGAIMIIAFAGGIVHVLEHDMILDTILHFIETQLEGLHAIVGAWAMFGFQSLLNFFTPSGSGQAAMTMPIIAPLSDLMGISRQTAVLAFQFGDGFSNLIIPTSAVTMSVLAIAEVPWTRWARWILPFELFLLAFGCFWLAVAVLIGYQ